MIYSPASSSCSSPVLATGALGVGQFIEINAAVGHCMAAVSRGGGVGLEGVHPGADLDRLLPNGGGGEVLFEGGGGDLAGEVELGGRAAEIVDGGVVGPRRGDGGGVGAEPDSGALVGLPDLGDPLAPLAHPYALVRPVAPPTSGWAAHHRRCCRIASAAARHFCLEGMVVKLKNELCVLISQWRV